MIVKLMGADDRGLPVKLIENVSRVDFSKDDTGVWVTVKIGEASERLGVHGNVYVMNNSGQTVERYTYQK